MFCFNCGCALTDKNFCPNCGVQVGTYKKIIHTSNRLYNDGLSKAQVRDLSGAVVSLKESLWCNKYNTDARNLLGLVYYEMGESVAALSEWVISSNYQPDDNRANVLMNQLQSGSQIQVMNKVIQKYNTALGYACNGNIDVAIIQLKSVLKTNPRYIRACQLLALLYIEDGKLEQARKLLVRCQSLDQNNLTTLRYMQEVTKRIDGAAENEGSPKKVTDLGGGVVSYKDGNEVIIQPEKTKNPGVDGSRFAGVINLIVGLVVGAALVGFLVLPARVQATRQQGADEVKVISEQLDARNASIADLNTQITSLDAEIEELQAKLTEYESTPDSMTGTDTLMSAANEYLSDGTGLQSAAEQFVLITDEDAENGSESFKKLYETLGNKLGDTLRQTCYDTGIEAYHMDPPDLETAITCLEKALSYSDSDTDGMATILYALADCYYQQYENAAEDEKASYSANLTRASELLNRLCSEYPASDLEPDAEELLEEMGTPVG